MKIETLSKEEVLVIDGGEPTRDTSAAYDIVWGISWVAREVYDGIANFIDTCGELPPGSQIRGH